MIKPDCQLLKDTEIIVDPQTLYSWLQYKAKEQELKYLLAHADDGVIWGKFDQDGNLITANPSKELFPNSEELFPKHNLPVLRSQTLQQCRAFGDKTEVMLWKVDKTWKARLIKDDRLSKEDYICEKQILWGTQREREKNGFTLVSDGSQGLKHAVPLTDITFQDKDYRPLRLKVRHYIDYDESGMARIYLSRLVHLESVKIESNKNEEKL
ncbi:type III-D CRISPR-associated protein Csx19 [Lyngbya aestuarii]|uniref:type III-D CRISPR-associated protein Csx19 n=1 Tax=Lyngbya aestuarii TaxID=118322 RepID=UPI0004266EC0|nr:CRISPR-associated protein Csx19 [Lyngbya aestuarii]